jgi:DNA-cytosine methyltransferase
VNLELFSASGGLAAGFRAAGIEFDLVIDRDPDACDSYAANLGQRPVQMDARDLLRMVRAGWRPGPVDLLVADPPCAPWSRAGKRRGLEDDRDMLQETADLIALLRPRAYLLGNIPGLQDAPAWGVVQRVIGGLIRYGYCVSDFAVLDAADFGVPQRRERPYWFGHMDGPCIRWPIPTHGNPATLPSLPGVASIEPWVTCRQALSHLPVKDLGRPVRLKLTDVHHPPSQVDQPAMCVRAGSGGGSNRAIALPQNHRANRMDEPSQTLVAKVCNVGAQVLEVGAASRRKGRPSTKGHQSGRIAPATGPSTTINTKQARVGAGNAVVEWPWDRPATTVCAEINKIAPAGEHGGQFGPNAILLSERAAAILQGFPDGWMFCGRTKRARWQQLGQAVPLVVAEAIGRAIVEQQARAAAEHAA